jgi:uncharacterized protein
MPKPMTEQERQEFLAERHVAVVSVAGDADRPPLAVPVWYGYQPAATSRSSPARRAERPGKSS